MPAVRQKKSVADTAAIHQGRTIDAGESSYPATGLDTDAADSSGHSSSPFAWSLDPSPSKGILTASDSNYGLDGTDETARSVQPLSNSVEGRLAQGSDGLHSGPRNKKGYRADIACLSW